MTTRACGNARCSCSPRESRPAHGQHRRHPLGEVERVGDVEQERFNALVTAFLTEASDPGTSGR